MASLISKIFDFEANQPIPSAAPLDAEFQQLINVLNGTATGTKLLVKSSDASDPVIECDQLGAGPLAEWKQNGTLKASIDNDGDLSANGLTGAAGVYTFSEVPVGPAEDPTTDNQLARKAYVDGKKTAFSIGFGIADPSTPTVAAIIPGSVAFICPAGTSITLTQAKINYQSGSHDASGGVEFTFTQRTAASNWVTANSFGTIALNGTNDTIREVYTVNFDDVVLAEGDTVILFISARTGTILERDVTVSLQGTQQLI